MKIDSTKYINNTCSARFSQTCHVYRRGARIAPRCILKFSTRARHLLCDCRSCGESILFIKKINCRDFYGLSNGFLILKNSSPWLSQFRKVITESSILMHVTDLKFSLSRTTTGQKFLSSVFEHKIAILMSTDLDRAL